MHIRSIPPEQQVATRWRNGGGSTREILRVGPEADFDWRFSLARVDRGGPFSTFRGYQRLSALIDGGPLTLQWPDGRELALAPRMKACAYAGDPPPQGLLEGEPALVCNLIARNGLDAQLLPRTLVGSMVFFDQAGVDWLLFLLSGEAELRFVEERHWLGRMHAQLLRGEGGSGRAVLEGGGEVLLARIGYPVGSDDYRQPAPG
ncbi:MAG: HutD family protein [Xanthomonadales bacterium]|nr:Protein Ves [Xanthomonadales bacterium]MCC6592085.1 HutD family protein [Xanthomonadales bacterium]MCE7931086.1 hypothetical protein [Xanthomonadales bacterium PRO6]